MFDLLGLFGLSLVTSFCWWSVRNFGLLLVKICFTWLWAWLWRLLLKIISVQQNDMEKRNQTFSFLAGAFFLRVSEWSEWVSFADQVVSPSRLLPKSSSASSSSSSSSSPLYSPNHVIADITNKNCTHLSLRFLLLLGFLRCLNGTKASDPSMSHRYAHTRRSVLLLHLKNNLVNGQPLDVARVRPVTGHSPSWTTSLSLEGRHRRPTLAWVPSWNSSKVCHRPIRTWSTWYETMSETLSGQRENRQRRIPTERRLKILLLDLWSQIKIEKMMSLIQLIINRRQVGPEYHTKKLLVFANLFRGLSELNFLPTFHPVLIV